MHERAVTESILEIALRHAEQASASRISDIYLVIGELSSIVDDSVQFYWDFVAENTIAQGSILHFKRLPTEMECRDCDHTFTPEHGEFSCPQCGSLLVKILSGDQFFMEAINVE